jgi:hypothetical protein
MNPASNVVNIRGVVYMVDAYVSPVLLTTKLDHDDLLEVVDRLFSPSVIVRHNNAEARTWLTRLDTALGTIDTNNQPT